MLAMIRTQVSLRGEQMEALRRLAHERGVSIAALVRDAVDRLLTTSRSPAEGRAAALAIVGAFESGEPDISERHDEYLDEAFGR